MQRTHLVRLRLFVRHPLTKLVVGLILIGTGTSEVIGDLINTHRSLRIGAHHGVIILGVMQVLQNVPPLIDGLDRWIAAIEAKEVTTSSDNK